MLQSKLIAGQNHFWLQKSVNNGFDRYRWSKPFLTDFGSQKPFKLRSLVKITYDWKYQWLRVKGKVNWTEMARFRLGYNCDQIDKKLLVLNYMKIKRILILLIFVFFSLRQTKKYFWPTSLVKTTLTYTHPWYQHYNVLESK
jgi:hypothetical protein